MTGYIMHIMHDCYDTEGKENRENHMVEVKLTDNAECYAAVRLISNFYLLLLAIEGTVHSIPPNPQFCNNSESSDNEIRASNRMDEIRDDSSFSSIF